MARVLKTKFDCESSIASIVENALSEAETLRDELQDWLDGMPENMQGGQKAEELEEAISALENVIADDDPLGELHEDIRAKAVVYTSQRKSKPSRAARASFQADLLLLVAEEIESADLPEAIGAEEEPEDNRTETAVIIRDLAEELTGISFPAMR